MKTSDVIDFVESKMTEQTSIIASLGRTGEEMFQRNREQTLFIDCMGAICSLSIGVALAVGESKPVIALDSDGSHLMDLSLLSTLGALSNDLNNLTILVLDNEIYESGGGMPSRYSHLDWALLGKAWGLRIIEVSTIEELNIAFSDYPTRFLYIIVKIKNDKTIDTFTKDIDGIESRYRFQRHLQNILNKKIVDPAIKG